MIDSQQFMEKVIRPATEAVGAGGPAADNLLLGTAAQESRLEYLHQLGGGPAVGVFQMEPATHDDIWANFLAYRDDLAGQIKGIAARINRGKHPPAGEMAWNLRYAAAMARVHYLRVPEALPDPDDTVGLGHYWKQHYNTSQGAGTVEEFVESFGSVEDAKRFGGDAA